MNHNKEIIEVFEAVLFALVCPFTFLLDDIEENEDMKEIKNDI